MGVNSAVLSFNEGSSGIYRVFKHLNLDLFIKKYDNQFCKKRPKAVTEYGEKRTTKKKKRRRKELRGIRKGWIDKDQEQLSKNSYKKGCF